MRSVRRAKVYARRRARRLAAKTQDLTAGQWADLVAAWGGCAYCGATGTSVQKDCVLPIAHGGRYTVTNVVPACPTCNASKGDAEVTAWLRHKRLDETRFLTRFLVIRAQFAADGTADRPVGTQAP